LIVQYILAAAGEPRQSFWVFGVVMCVFAIVVLVQLMRVLQILPLMIQARMANVEVGFVRLLGMRLRKVDARLIVNAMISAHQGGLNEITLDMLEAHYLAGGRVLETVQEMIIAKQAKVPLNWSTAAALDLRDVVDQKRQASMPAK